MFPRTIHLKQSLEHKSLFLFGARQTGKSTLLRTLFPEAKVFDLLAADVFRALSSNPETVRQSLTPHDTLIVIDEIQKLPSLLDEVHLLIERNKSMRFILTGSSARKLRRSGVNLLAGRAWTEHLFPLTSREVGAERIPDLLLYGGLPPVLESKDPSRELKEYVGVYLQEEIRAESLTRSIEAFSRFLTIAGLVNGQQVNYTKVGNDAQVPPRTIREFFSVLEDTLVAYQVKPRMTSKKRKSVSTSKFYFFDIGVAHALQGVHAIFPGTIQYGLAIEHLIANELRAALHYKRRDTPLNYWRSLSQMEVDFVVGDDVAIEVKASGNVSERDTKGLAALSEEVTCRRKIIVCLESARRRFSDGTEVLPLADFLEELWQGDVI